MNLMKNEVVAVPNGYIIQYENRSWLCRHHDRFYWCPQREDAAVFKSKIGAKILAFLWDRARKKAVKDMTRNQLG